MGPLTRSELMLNMNPEVPAMRVCGCSRQELQVWCRPTGGLFGDRVHPLLTSTGKTP
jgi:hypothetical protein